MLIDLLRADGSVIANKNLIHAIGLNAAIFYSELVSKRAYFEERDDLTEDGYFYNTVDNIRLDTGLGEKPQTAAIKKLESLGLIHVDRRGLPRKRYFKVFDDIELVKSILSEGKQIREELKEELDTKSKEKKDDYTSRINSTTQREELSNSKREELGQPKGSRNNTNLNNTKNYNKNKGAERDSARVAFSFQEFKEQFSIDDIGVIECVEYYLTLYQQYRREGHPNLKAEQWQYVVEYMFYVEDDDTGGYFDLTENDVIDMMDQHFKTKYKKCDYNILHFMTNGVRVKRMYEVAY